MAIKLISLPFCDISSMISLHNDKAYGYNNSYALLVPASVPLPIVSIKIGYNICYTKPKKKEEEG